MSEERVSRRGRPRKTEGAALKARQQPPAVNGRPTTIVLRIPTETKRKLRMAAARYLISVSEVITDLTCQITEEGTYSFREAESNHGRP